MGQIQARNNRRTSTMISNQQEKLRFMELNTSELEQEENPGCLTLICQPSSQMKDSVFVGEIYLD